MMLCSVSLLADLSGGVLRKLTPEEIRQSSLDNLNGPIAPNTSLVYFDDLMNSANYTETFKVNPINGTNLNIFVSNTGSSSIEVNISIGGASITGYPKIIAPGEQDTYTTTNIAYTATWKLAVNDRTGGKMSGQTKARQFIVEK